MPTHERRDENLQYTQLFFVLNACLVRRDVQQKHIFSKTRNEQKRYDDTDGNAQHEDVQLSHH
jgi:hypothetical protein